MRNARKWHSRLKKVFGFFSKKKLKKIKSQKIIKISSNFSKNRPNFFWSSFKRICLVHFWFGWQSIENNHLRVSATLGSGLLTIFSVVIGKKIIKNPIFFRNFLKISPYFPQNLFSWKCDFWTFRGESFMIFQKKFFFWWSDFFFSWSDFQKKLKISKFRIFEKSNFLKFT